MPADNATHGTPSFAMQPHCTQNEKPGNSGGSIVNGDAAAPQEIAITSPHVPQPIGGGTSSAGRAHRPNNTSWEPRQVNGDGSQVIVND